MDENHEKWLKRRRGEQQGAVRLLERLRRRREEVVAVEEAARRSEEWRKSIAAKYAAAEAALNAVDAAIQTHGGNGLSTEYGLMPYWGMARLLRTAPVSREMSLNFVAQHDLGLARSY